MSSSKSYVAVPPIRTVGFVHCETVIADSAGAGLTNRRPTRRPLTLNRPRTASSARSSLVVRRCCLRARPRRSLARRTLTPDSRLQQRNDGEKGIQVGELIAILAEEGDDLSSLSADAFESGSPDTSPPSKEAAVPEVSTSSSSTSSSPSSSSSSSPSSHHAPTIKHAQPISPSVQRILLGSSLTTEQISALKGSGMRGALTKGDVLKAIGAIKNVWGSKEAETLETEGRKGVSARYKVHYDICHFNEAFD